MSRQDPQESQEATSWSASEQQRDLAAHACHCSADSCSCTPPGSVLGVPFCSSSCRAFLQALPCCVSLHPPLRASPFTCRGT